MSDPLTPEKIERLAKKRADAKFGWYMHAAIFVLVNVVLLAVSNYGIGRKAWSYQPTLAWGFGLAVHGLSVWFMGAETDFRERLIQRERERLQRQLDERNKG